MIDAIRERFERAGQRLVARHPYLYVLRLHVVVPLIVAATLVAGGVACVTPIGLRSVPNVEVRLAVGLCGSLVLALTWVYFVTRDTRRFWPIAGSRRFVWVALAAGCLIGMTAPPNLHARILLGRIVEKSASIPEAELELLKRMAVELRHEMATPLRPLDAEVDRKREELRRALAPFDAAPGDLLTSAEQLDELTRNLYELSSSPHLLEDFHVPISGSIACAGLVLAVLVVFGETSLGAGLLGLAVFVGYFAVWLLLLSTLTGSELTPFGWAGFWHWVVIVVLVSVQWVRRSSSWFSRATGMMLGFLTPFVGLGLVFAEVVDVRDDNVPWLVLGSGIFYFALLPFVHGNLARLRYLPRP